MNRRDGPRTLRSRLVSGAIGIAVGLLAASARGETAAVDAPHVHVELLSDSAMLAPGREATLGVRFVLEDEWHVYWSNPGDSGDAPSVVWTLPQGFSVDALQWPTPHRIAVGPLTNFGYAKTALLAAPLHVPGDLGGAASIDVRAHVKWLVCNPEECIPGEAALSLPLPAGTTAAPSVHARLFESIRTRWPVAPPSTWAVFASATPDQVTLTIHGLTQPLLQPPVFFPYGRESIEPSAPQVFAVDDDGFRLTLQRWPQAASTSLEGILAVGERSYPIAVPLAAPGMSFEPLLLAFAGGLLLNLMPCVFPVLALKALALVGLAGERGWRARRHGVLYGVGVVVAFWALATVLLVVRAGGEQLGWGFQLQSPAVVAALAALFFWMALVLLGFASVGASIMGVGNGLTVGDGDRSAFFTGVLATVVATPCTAPFMGAALGYALVQPPLVAIAVFTALGIGLALPYVAVTFVPALGSWLPRPGAWMETLKQLLAFPLLATVVWLVWVTSLQGGPPAVLATLSILLLIGFAVWIGGHTSPVWSRLGAAAAVGAALVVGCTITPSANLRSSANDSLAWEPYSAVRLGELLREGKPVFVDFTAAWCVTCQVNKRLVLETEPVATKMRELGVVPVRADWTRPNPDISRALQQFGRDGIPLYVLYSGRENDPPRILPQLLTKTRVITELEQLDKRSKT